MIRDQLKARGLKVGARARCIETGVEREIKVIRFGIGHGMCKVFGHRAHSRNILVLYSSSYRPDGNGWVANWAKVTRSSHKASFDNGMSCCMM